MKCYAQAAPEGCVILVTPTGTTTLTPEQGHRLLYHGSGIVVDDVVVARNQRVVIVAIGGAHYTIDANTLGQVFRGKRVRCQIHSVDSQIGGACE